MAALVENHEPALGVDGGPDDENHQPCQVKKRLWLLTQSSLDSKTKTIGQQNICATTEAMIDEVEMGFFFDGLSEGLPEDDGAQPLHDVYDDWTSTHHNPWQLYEANSDSDFEISET